MENDLFIVKQLKWDGYQIIGTYVLKGFPTIKEATNYIKENKIGYAVIEEVITERPMFLFGFDTQY